jgi:hypothetical protein
MRNRKLKSALQAVADGHSVLPLHWATNGRCSCRKRDCASVGKHPLTRHGVHDATRNEATIRHWWSKYPKANIGVATGKISDLIVIDVDTRHGGKESLARFESENGPLPDGPIGRTGVGLHRYFKYSTASVGNKVGLLPGVDVRSDGGYVVYPGSIHRSGRRYRWVHGKSPSKIRTLPFPASLLRLAKARTPSAPPESEPSIPKGKRNATLTSHAGAMRHRGMTCEAIEAALLKDNSLRCDPPLPESEVLNIVRSVGKYPPRRKHKQTVAEWAQQDDATVTAPVEDQSVPPDDWRAKPFRGKWTVGLPEALFREYLILPRGIPFVASLWVIATHIFQIFESFPYLAVTSPTKRCGKTTFALLLELLCARPLMAVNISEAALFRYIATEKPTVIIDEAEALRNKNSDRTQYLLPILQAGYKDGSFVPRCVGSDFKVKKFGVYCPKAVLAIGSLPDTLTDRSILVSMRRRLTTEVVGRFRRRVASEQASGIVSAISSWAEAHKEQVAKVYSKQDLDFLRDREADIWEPLFAIAAVAVPERIEELKNIALHLSSQKELLDADDSQGIQLLSDIRSIFAGSSRDSIPSADLVKRLQKHAANHWAEDFSQTKLARLLRPFGITPQQLWLDEGNIRGYRREDFEPTFERYLPTENC